MATPTPSSAKAKMLAVIDSLPEDSSFDDLLRELAFYRLVDRGLYDLERDRTVSNEKLRHQVRAWRS